jgi:hypothetical protein
VFYGLGATSNSFNVDWLHGTQFALACNWVRVTAVSYAPNPTGGYDGAGGLIRIAAGVAEGNVGKGLPASLTESKLGSTPAAVSFESPDFAKSVIVWPGGVATTDAIQLIGAGSLNPFTGTIASWSNTVIAQGGLPLAGSVRRLIWTPSGVNQVLTVQWLLGL